MRSYLRRPADVAAAAVNSWTIPALLTAYNWPTGLAGGGEIAIGELGGAWYPADMATYFKSIGQPVPTIATIGKMSPDPGGADVEVALDIQMAAAGYHLATGKPASVFVYFYPNSTGGFEDAIKQAAADGRDAMSWSWGEAESGWGRTAAEALDAIAAAAAAAGMILTAAAGDTGYEDGTDAAEVDFPASSPHFLACGGTRKTRLAETCWHDVYGATGGGYSKFFARPSWQTGVPTLATGRMVSDVAGNADPATGVQIFVNGAPLIVGGTSADAPLWAGLLASLGRKLGIMQPKLYANPGAFTKIAKGNNGKWPADVCDGLGVPNGAAVAKLFGV